MKITYSEILDKMKTAFTEKSGESASDYSEILLKMEALATELYAVYCYGDYIEKSAFPQSASGEYLDMHGELRDVKRKQKSKAKGKLTFSVSTAAQTDIVIPLGTVCSVKNKPFVQFATDEECSILSGSTSVSVNATAISFGKESNAKENTVTVMVNPPASVDLVTNEAAFCGGCDDEKDDAYRERILSSFSVPLNGFSANSLSMPVMKLDFVTDCNVVSNENEILIYVKTRSGSLSDNEKALIKDAIGINTLVSKDISVLLATSKEVDVLVEAVCDEQSNDTKSEIISIISSYFDNKIAGLIYKNSIETEILESGLASNIKIYINGESKPVLAAESDKYFTIQNAEVCFVDKL